MNGDLRASMNSTSSEKLGATYGMLWFDIEGTQYWSSSTSSNVNFLQSMVNEAKARGVSIGKNIFSCYTRNNYNLTDMILIITIHINMMLLQQESTVVTVNGLRSWVDPLHSLSILFGMLTTTTRIISPTSLLSVDGQNPTSSSIKVPPPYALLQWT